MGRNFYSPLGELSRAIPPAFRGVAALAALSALGYGTYRVVRDAQGMQKHRGDRDALAEKLLDASCTTGDPPSGSEAAAARKPPGLDRAFLSRFLKLLRILVPRVFCKTTLLLSLHTSYLLLRSWLLTLLVRINGKVARRMVELSSPAAFAQTVAHWAAVGLASTCVDSTMKYLETSSSLHLRTVLTDHLMEKYLKNQVRRKKKEKENTLVGKGGC